MHLLLSRAHRSRIDSDRVFVQHRFGTVYKATLKGKHEVAVKTMRVAKITEEELAKFKSELIIMAPLHHPARAARHSLSPLSPPSPRYARRTLTRVPSRSLALS